jgi:hypothetical protein
LALVLGLSPAHGYYYLTTRGFWRRQKAVFKIKLYGYKHCTAFINLQHCRPKKNEILIMIKRGRRRQSLKLYDLITYTALHLIINNIAAAFKGTQD